MCSHTMLQRACHQRCITMSVTGKKIIIAPTITIIIIIITIIIVIVIISIIMISTLVVMTIIIVITTSAVGSQMRPALFPSSSRHEPQEESS